MFLIFFFFLFTTTIFPTTRRPISRFFPIRRIFLMRSAGTLDNGNKLHRVAIINLIMSTRARFSILNRRPSNFGITRGIYVARNVFAMARIPISCRSIIRWTSKRSNFNFCIAPTFFSNNRIHACIPILIISSLQGRIIRLTQRNTRNR